MLVMGFIAVFHSSQNELDEMKLHCAKQQDSLNNQMLSKCKPIDNDRLWFFSFCICFVVLNVYTLQLAKYNYINNVDIAVQCLRNH